MMASFTAASQVVVDRNANYSPRLPSWLRLGKLRNWPTAFQILIGNEDHEKIYDAVKEMITFCKRT